MSAEESLRPGSSLLRAAHPAVAWLSRTVAPGAQLSADSRAVRPGDVFVAIPGATHDGRHHVPDAMARGAAAVIWDCTAFAWPADWQIANRPERELKKLCGAIAAAWYRHPADSLLSIAVTGTSGKSSSVLWLADALSALERPCAVVGTLGIGFPGQLEDSGNTTPDPIVLQRRLRALVDSGARACAMEVSSIGIEEGRVDAMRFDVALFTNLSRDHLDYHGSMAAYEVAKARLFTWPGIAHAVVNVDDAAGVRIATLAANSGVAVTRFSAAGGHDAELRARSVAIAGAGLAFEVFGAFGVRQVRAPFIGAYNVANLLGVVGVLMASGFDVDAALAALAALRPVPGRLELVVDREAVDREAVDRGTDDADHDSPLVLVDYAHKPDALEKVLSACRPLADARDGRLVVVFGCGGDRDAGKRPLMGEIAARLADAVVVTSDNPRSESPIAIIDQIRAGIGAGMGSPARFGQVVVEPDRRAAIAAAIREASERDVILIAGKGHESYQEIAGTKLAFSDVTVAAEALRRRAPTRAQKDPVC